MMIVGADFIWLHLPKTAGHAVEAAIRCAAAGRGDVRFDAPDHAGWHEGVEARRGREGAFAVEGKVVLAGFRRLPWWILSRVHYEAARPPYRVATREMICAGRFFERDGAVNAADDYAHVAVDSGVSRWLRAEHLGSDFVREFGDLFGPRVRRAARRLRKLVNPTQVSYIRALDFYFTEAELRGLYEANPLWASVERRLYGGLLCR